VRRSQRFGAESLLAHRQNWRRSAKAKRRESCGMK
jgi:hypothetical protein